MGRDARGRNFGNLRLMTVLGFNLVVAPDVCMWIVPTSITLGLFSGALYIAGTRPLTRWSDSGTETTLLGVVDLLFTVGLVVAGFTLSLMGGLTDPGAIPRVEIERGAAHDLQIAKQRQLNDGGEGSAMVAVPAGAGDERACLIDWDDLGRIDPYGDQKGWTECRTCNLRRPPRAAHCYSCGVCMLESDHHCGVLGFCACLRTLRFFVAYLVCTSVAALNTMTWVMAGLFDKNVRANASAMAINIMLLVFIGNVLLMVGGLACFYVWLVVVDMTRRETKKSAAGSKALVQHYHEHLTPKMLESSSKCFGNVRRVMDPPPSLIAWTPSSSTL